MKYAEEIPLLVIQGFNKLIFRRFLGSHIFLQTYYI